MASLGYSALTPVKENTSSNSQRLTKSDELTDARLSVIDNQIHEFERLVGATQQVVNRQEAEHTRIFEGMQRLSSRAFEHEAQIAETAARVSDLREKVRDVDIAGSRKWIGKTHE